MHFFITKVKQESGFKNLLKKISRIVFKHAGSRRHRQNAGFSQKKANQITGAMVARLNGLELTDEQAKLLESVKDNSTVLSIFESANSEDNAIGRRRQQLKNLDKDIATGWISQAITKSVSEQEFTPTGNYAVSEDGKTTALATEEVDGKTITKDTGEVIDIKGVKSISKGKMILDIGDGQEIDAKNVAYASKNDALIYEAVASLGDNIDPDTANRLISNYDGSNAMVYARGIAQAYTYGFYGLDRTEMNGKKTLSAALTEEQRNYAYSLGEKYRTVKDQHDKENAQKKKAASGEKGVYYRDKDGNATDIRTYLKEANVSLKDVQKTAIEVMEKMSEMMGVRFNVFETWVENGKRYYLDENGVKTEGNPNGFYDTKTGEIYIDLNAGNDYQGTMLFTVAHELTHFMRQWSPEHFTKISRIVFKHAGFKGRVSALIAAKMESRKAKGKPISYDTAVEEVVADAMETILKDGKVVEFMAEVKQKDHKAWAKLKEWFKNFAKFLKELVDVYSGHSAQTVEGRKVAEFSQDLLQQIERIWAEGAAAAGENYQTAKTQKNTTDDGGVEDALFSIKRTRKMTLAEQLSAYYNVDPNKRFKRSDSFYFGITPSTLSRSGLDADPLAFFQDDFAKSTRIKHKIPRRVLKKLNENLAKPIFSFTAGKQAAVVIDDIDGDGKPVAVAIHGGHSMDRKPVNRIASIYGIDSVKEWVKTQIDGGGKFRVYNIEKANAMLQTQGYLAAVGTQSDGSWDIITEVTPDVNTESAEALDVEVDAKTESAKGDHNGAKLSDRDSDGHQLSAAQQEFFRNSQVRNANGDLLIVRHGTDADFDTFAFEKAGQNGKAEGYGFYFSDDPEITSRYGSIQKEVYLNITKPLYGTKRTIKKAELAKFVDALIAFDLDKYQADGLTWQDSFISNYVDTYAAGKSRSYAVNEFVNQIWDYNTNDQDLIFEIANADGRMHESSTMKELYTVLTESIGYDGIIARWSHKDGYSNVYVTFTSEQAKYITNTSPTSNPDLRYSDRKEVKTFKNGQNAKGEFVADVLIDLADTESKWWTGRYNHAIFGMSKTDDTEFRQFYQEILKRTKDMDEYGESKQSLVEDTFTVHDGKGKEYIYVVKLDGYLHGVVLEKINKAKYEAALRRETKGGNYGKSDADIKRRARNAWNDLGRDRSGDGRTSNSDGAARNGGMDSGSPQSDMAGNDEGEGSTDRKVSTVTTPNSGHLLQDRTDTSVSNRSLLANALEAAVRDDTERQKLQEYREQIARLDELEQKLQQLNAQIKELSFAKGPRDTKKIRELRDEATKIANRISIYDKQLLRLEASLL